MVCNCSGGTQARWHKLGGGKITRGRVRRIDRVAILRIGTECVGKSCGDRGASIMAFSAANVHYSRMALNNITTPFSGRHLSSSSCEDSARAARRLDGGRVGRRYK